MTWLGIALGTLLVVALVAAAVAAPIAVRRALARRRESDPAYVPPGFGGGPFEELYHPSAYEAKVVQDAASVPPAPAPAPGDPPIESGPIRIDLSYADRRRDDHANG
ncbi:hypothetical protein QT381_04140 [Galbitalea sp. SE-J8]|uniref:hypothetical protein n=1 Tax=Galbitalea sp. SE-J8 TaxID=3054952 RepID=UPI00259D1C20|nr:hypothetical protein [Galbitalea sp. SE-J8]MDM4762194.1 hypothetical protein [Galbitalea sp. SE-J8]